MERTANQFTDNYFFPSVLIVLISTSSFWQIQISLLLTIAGLLYFTLLIYKEAFIKNLFNKALTLPNFITCGRLFIVFFLLFQKKTSFIFILACTNLCLDFLDGFLARKLNQMSAFGTVFDPEVDAFFCLTMSVLILQSNPQLYWILVGGLARYIYLIVTYLIPQRFNKFQKNNYAKFIAGVYFGCLTAYFIFPLPYNSYIVVLGTLLVLFSFGRSFYFFYARK